MKTETKDKIDIEGDVSPKVQQLRALTDALMVLSCPGNTSAHPLDKRSAHELAGLAFNLADGLKRTVDQFIEQRYQERKNQLQEVAQ